MLPVDYGALCLQFATAIHSLVPEAKLGGPAFEGVNADVEVWPDAEGRVCWLGRFLDYLKVHGRLGDFTFSRSNIIRTTPATPVERSLSRACIGRPYSASLERRWFAGKSAIFQTEGNLGAVSGEKFVDIVGGLWLADYVGSMMSGGSQRNLLLPLPAGPAGG
jgi:hypothetical protein